MRMSMLDSYLPRRLVTGLFVGTLCFLALASTAVHAQPITSDSRIKTFVYNPNEVFTITTHYGYQSNIEFGPKETIETISVGDRVAWQIIPAGRRLFIRAQEENAHTNMTIVTNMRAYQFDLRSSAADAVFGSEQLTYVVRFYYPTDPSSNMPALPQTSTYIPQSAMLVMAPPAPTAIPAPAPMPKQPEITSAPIAAPAPITLTPPPAAGPTRSMSSAKALNYRYTFSGPSDIAPTKIYDDGKTTYFKLPSADLPKFSILTAKGDSVSVAARRTDGGLVAVDAIAPRFSLNEAGRQVIVYNEAGPEVR